MSLIVMAGTPWPNEYEGTVKWSEKTRQAQFGEHGPLFDRFFSFEDNTVTSKPGREESY